MDAYGSTPNNLLVIYQAHIHHTSQIYKTQITHPCTACVPEHVVCANVDKGTGNDVEMTWKCALLCTILQGIRDDLTALERLHNAFCLFEHVERF